jgi:hypothetical protein
MGRSSDTATGGENQYRRDHRCPEAIFRKSECRSVRERDWDRGSGRKWAANTGNGVLNPRRDHQSGKVNAPLVASLHALAAHGAKRNSCGRDASSIPSGTANGLGNREVVIVNKLWIDPVNAA